MHRGSTAHRIGAAALASLAVHALGPRVAIAAAEPPRIAVAPLGAGEGVLDKTVLKFGQAISDELKTRDDDLRWVAFPRSAAPAPSPAAPSSRKTPSAEAVDALAQGGKAMDSLQFEDAVASLKKGVELEEADPATADFKEIDLALVRLAAGYFRMGEEKKAQQALFQVARLNPDYALPDGQFPPVFKREFEKAQKRVEKAAKGTLTIDGPSGATAFLNGRDLGMVPVHQEDVTVGINYVRVEGSHGERFGQAVELKGGQAKVRASFSGSAGGGASGVASSELRGPATLDAEFAAKAARAARSLDAEFLLVGYLTRSGEHKVTFASALYSARKQGFARLPPHELDDEVLTANVEAFRLADDIIDKTKAFEPDVLPLSLSEVKVAATETPRPRKPRTEATSDQPTRQGSAEKPTLVPGEDGTKVRALQHRSELVDSSGDNGAGTDADAHKTVSKGVPWWVFVAAGVAVVAAAGGGIYAYSQATQPVSGTAKTTW